VPCMNRKLDAGALLVAAAALLLVVSLFLDWFGLDGGRAGYTAWEVFEVHDLLLLLAALAAVAAAFGLLDSRVLLGAAAVAVVVVVSQLIDAPPAAQGSEREVGAWLALVAAFGLLAGAALAAAQIAVTVDVRNKERRRRVAAVDKRPTAAAGTPATGSGVAATATYDGPVADRFAPEPAGDPDATAPFTAQQEHESR
jgi:hypothetical protein